MTAFVALLRAVNVGGTGTLPMRDLVAMCEHAGYRNVRTYIASGNVVFSTRAKESAVKAALEKALQAYAGKPVGVLVRTADELAAVTTGIGTSEGHARHLAELAARGFGQPARFASTGSLAAGPPPESVHLADRS